MIKIKHKDDHVRISAAVTDFADSLGYCQYKIPLSIKGVKGSKSEALTQGHMAHLEEEVFEQEHVKLEPVTVQHIMDAKKDVEFAREGVFSVFQIPFEFSSKNILVTLHGRIDKIMRVGSTLLVEDDKFTTNPSSYDQKTEPYPGQMLQVLTYLNSLYSTKWSNNPNDWFELPHEQKRWQIRICDSRTREPYKIFSDYENTDAQRFLHQSLRTFASVAAGIDEPVHHNSKSKCNACNLKNFCDFRI